LNVTGCHSVPAREDATHAHADLLFLFQRHAFAKRHAIYYFTA